jgi:hypothetical protein
MSTDPSNVRVGSICTAQIERDGNGGCLKFACLFVFLILVPIRSLGPLQTQRKEGAVLEAEGRARGLPDHIRLLPASAADHAAAANRQLLAASSSPSSTSGPNSHNDSNARFEAMVGVFALTSLPKRWCEHIASITLVLTPQ